MWKKNFVRYKTKTKLDKKSFELFIIIIEVYMPLRLEERCAEKGLEMTSQRRTIACVLSGSVDHPDVELLYQRTQKIDPKISMATVYRTVRLFEEAGVIDKHD